MVKIKFLGTGTSYPTRGRVSSSCLVTVNGTRFLIDIGPSVLRRLVEYGLSVNNIDLILLTHFHVDHSGDLPAFLFACNYGIEPRMKPLKIIGGEGVRSFFRRVSLAFPWIKPKSYDLQILKVVNGKYSFCGVEIETKRTNHNRESIAIRMNMGVSVVFSGDTDYSKNLIELSRGVDLLIVECSFPERKVKGHMNLPTLKRIVEASKPKQVVITHLYPDWDEKIGEISSPYTVSYDGMEIEFNR